MLGDGLRAHAYSAHSLPTPFQKVLTCDGGFIQASLSDGDGASSGGNGTGHSKVGTDTFRYTEGLLVFLQFSKVGSSTMRRLLGYSTYFCNSIPVHQLNYSYQFYFFVVRSMAW